MNIKFKNGEIHEIDMRQSIRSFGIKLKCGLVAKGMINTRHSWHFTRKKATCKHCIKKTEVDPMDRIPTDLSNYHTFIKD